MATGTAWVWARPEFRGAVDVLFVDEAGQMSLANVLALAQAAESIVLLGDPQQLEQPQQGSHPEGTEVSALEHLLQGRQTIADDRGLFLDETWRLHPDICLFTSELFYEGRLESRPGLENQALRGSTPLAGAGLWFLAVEHEGNQNSSPEEVEAVGRLVESLTDGVLWVDAQGEESALDTRQVLVVCPYNAQVADVTTRLPGHRVGTVDKFQGQEAPVVVFSLATSSPELAPRGMEFLYSLNRLNVATSRARATCILVASPRLFEPRDDESGRYFVVRLEAIPEIYGTGYTKQAALAALKSAFDDQIIWCLEEGLEIPEPGLVPAQSARSIEITMVRIAPPGPASASHESGETKARTQTAEIVESFRSREPIDVGALQKVA